MALTPTLGFIVLGPQVPSNRAGQLGQDLSLGPVAHTQPAFCPLGAAHLSILAKVPLD